MLIDTNGIRLNVRTYGQLDGNLPPLVFLHYWGGSSRTWEPAISALPAGYGAYAADLRGWGESDKPADGYAIADLADDVQGMLQALKLKRFVLVGHSMGGKTAQLLASRRPEGLEALVLVAPSPPVPMPVPAEQRAGMVHAYDAEESVAFVLDHVLTAAPIDSALRSQVIADSLRGAPQAKAAWPMAGMLEDISAQVGAIAVPTLVIAGERDQVDSVDTLQRELLPRIPGARLQVLPGIGHLSPLEAPAMIAASIHAFVQEYSGNRRF